MLKDIRDYQILSLSSFLVLGIGTRDWTLRPELILITILTCLTTQWLAENITFIWLYLKQNIFNHSDRLKFSLVKPQKPTSLRSAAITALSLCLLLRSDNYTTMILAASLAISSKFIFQIHHKHFFNPANFGIISVLALTNDAWVSPGQWGEDWWYVMLFIGSGGMILKRIGRWDTTAAFLGSYAFLEAIRNIWLGWTWDVYFHKLMSGSLLLFALFMITDPRSIPNAKIGRLTWAICIALLTFILRNYFFISTAIFWSLFLFAPLTILFDYVWSAPTFSWSFFTSYLPTFKREEKLIS